MSASNNRVNVCEFRVEADKRQHLVTLDLVTSSLYPCSIKRLYVLRVWKFLSDVLKETCNKEKWRACHCLPFLLKLVKVSCWSVVFSTFWVIINLDQVWKSGKWEKVISTAYVVGSATQSIESRNSRELAFCRLAVTV